MGVLQVVDLLVAMTKAACKSNRKKTIFDPYPTVVDPQNSQELSLNPKVPPYTGIKRKSGFAYNIMIMTTLKIEIIDSNKTKYG